MVKMSVPLGVAARAPRSSGLKKPRPLRSTSLQETSKESEFVYTSLFRDYEIIIMLFEMKEKRAVVY